MKFFACFLLVLLTLSQSVCIAQDLEIVTEPKIAWQGKILKVQIVPPEGISKAEATFLGQKFPCYKRGDDFCGIVGVPIDQKPGYYNLSLIVTRKDGSTEKITKRMKVWATKFPFSRMWLRPAKKKLMIRELINKEWAEIEKGLVVEDPVQRWIGKFLWPIKGKVSQGFGYRQIINGKRGNSHRGVDIAIPNGTKVKAPNRGKVVFVKRLKAFGGTLVIDHGQGVHTLYFHLSKILVKVGDEVEKGDVIALTGDSGISSGPHLHWGMSVHNLRVDPIQWIKYEI
jgi:hypothetical protein